MPNFRKSIFDIPTSCPLATTACASWLRVLLSLSILERIPILLFGYTVSSLTMNLLLIHSGSSFSTSRLSSTCMASRCNAAFSWTILMLSTARPTRRFMMMMVMMTMKTRKKRRVKER